MMSIENRGTCESCSGTKPATTWVEIGSQVHIKGGREGDTHHTIFQCHLCGSVWLRVQDQGGAGGSGTYFHLLTGRFYSGSDSN